MSYQSRLPRRISQHQSLKRQSGVVIVIALFIVALVAAMSYVMMSRLVRDTQRTTLILRNTQADFYAQGSIAWAMDQLRNDWEQQKNGQLIDVIPMKSPVNEMNGYQIQSTIYDMQARFNLNNINAAESQAVFMRLLQLTNPKIKLEDILAIIRALIDWVTPGSGQNDLVTYYAAQPVPYRAAHRLMQSATELLLVKGITPAMYNALSPYVTALPVSTQINVQTAAPIVLAALSPTMTLDAAVTLEKVRLQKPFLSPDDFLKLDVVKNHAINAELVTVVSQYFLVETKVTIEKQEVVIYTLMERVKRDRKALINILWQSKGIM